MDVLYTTPGWQEYVLNQMIAHDTTLCVYALAFVGVCLLAFVASSPFLRARACALSLPPPLNEPLSPPPSLLSLDSAF